MMGGFHITGGRGFHVTFANGFTVSVQFGIGNYHSLRRGLEQGFPDSGEAWGAAERDAGSHGSTNAEVAVFSAKHADLLWMGSDTVRGWQTPDQVLALMVEVAALPEDAGFLPSVGPRPKDPYHLEEDT